MRILLRLTLLSFFAATGVALAVYVGSSTGPGPTGDAPGYSVKRHPADESEKVRPADQGDAKGLQQAPQTSPQNHIPQTASTTQEHVPVTSPQSNVPTAGPETTDTAGADSNPPALSTPEGPVLAEPHPGRAIERSSGGKSPGLEKTFRLWKTLAAPLLAQVARDFAPPAQKPAPQPLAAGEAAAGPADPRRKPDDATGDTRVQVHGEGDGELCMQFPNSDIREVLDALSVQGNLNILATDSVQGNISATLSGVDVESALDAILKSTGYVARRDGDFIYVGKPEDFEDLEKALDTVSTRVYRPNYVTAAELEALIQPLITTGVGVVAVSSPAEMGIAADSDNAGGDAFAGGEVVVVRDYEAVLAEIDQVVAEIDVRPMQVAIEAMILSVTLDDGNDFGVSFELLRNKEHVRLGWGAPLDTLSSLAFDTGGLKFGFLDSSLGVFLEALESIGDTNVIATPRLMVLNKHRAEILIGEELGYVSTTITETSASQSVEFLEVGTQLRLRPFISSDGLIRMEVHPELSTGSVETESGFTLPNKETTQVTTNIMVRDGGTVIIGGLIREELQTTGKQVPFLGSLPLVGWAFRSRNETLQRREILVLITPHIVYEPETCEEGERGACEFHRRQEVYREKMNPLGKRHVARKYFRMAQNAWAAGDRDAALRYAEMSIHFDPLNRAAIDLRSNIWLGQRSGDHTLDGPATVLPTAPLDGTLIDPWLLDQLQGEPIPTPQPLHPLDPGQPGQRINIERPRRFP